MSLIMDSFPLTWPSEGSVRKPIPFNGQVIDARQVDQCLPAGSMLAQLAPIALTNLNAIILRRFFCILKCQIPILIENALHLIEARKRVPDMACVGQGLLAVLRKGEDTVGQIALSFGFPVSERGFQVVLLDMRLRSFVDR